MENDLHLTQHISQRFNEELEEVRTKVLTMGGLVEEQVANGVKAVIKSDASLGKKVAKQDYKVNALEVELDEQCVNILARRQPTASDLRLVVAVIKTITDLERIGDQAEKLGELSIKLSTQGVPHEQFVELAHIGKLVQGILRSTLDAFARIDVDDALKTIALDDQVDQEFDALSRQLITYMMEDPRQIKAALRISWCARALERIGDHCKNICEYILYLVEGKDVRHITLEEKQEVLQAETKGA